MFLDEKGERNILAKVSLLGFGESVQSLDNLGDQLINNSIYLHAYHTIESKKQTVGMFVDSKYDQSLIGQVENHILSKSDLLAEKWLFDLQFWQIGKRNYIKDYYKKYEAELRRQLKVDANDDMEPK